MPNFGQPRNPKTGQPNFDASGRWTRAGDSSRPSPRAEARKEATNLEGYGKSPPFLWANQVGWFSTTIAKLVDYKSINHWMRTFNPYQDLLFIHHDHHKWGISWNRGIPIAGWFIMEIPIKMDDLVVPPFQETSKKKTGPHWNDG